MSKGSLIVQHDKNSSIPRFASNNVFADSTVLNEVILPLDRNLKSGTVMPFSSLALTSPLTSLTNRSSKGAKAIFSDSFSLSIFSMSSSFVNVFTKSHASGQWGRALQNLHCAHPAFLFGLSLIAKSTKSTSCFLSVFILSAVITEVVALSRSGWISPSFTSLISGYCSSSRTAYICNCLFTSAGGW